MDFTERYLGLAKEIETATGKGDPNLKAKVEEFAELKLEGAGDHLDLRIQESILPDLIAHEERTVWWPLWQVSEDWLRAETLTELHPNPKAIEIFEITDWDDDQMRKDAAENLDIELDEEEED